LFTRLTGLDGVQDRAATFARTNLA